MLQRVVKGVLMNAVIRCREKRGRDALALIKELTEENDELYRLVDDKIQECEKWKSRLKIECEYTKADTVRKMQERLKEAPIKVGLPLFGLQTKDEVEDYANGLILQMRDAIDQIAKEMLEGDQ